MQRFHLSLETLYAVDHIIEGLERLIRVFLSKTGIGSRLERSQDFLVLSLDMSLNGLEILTGKLVGKTEKRLVLRSRTLAQVSVAYKEELGRTSSMWLSWLSLVVVSSAAMLRGSRFEAGQRPEEWPVKRRKDGLAGKLKTR